MKTDLYRYIELFYNRKCLHSTLGYMSPVAYRLANSQQVPKSGGAIFRFSVPLRSTLNRKIVRKDEAQTSFPTISDVSMQDSLLQMVDIFLSYVFSTNPVSLMDL